MNLVQMRPKGHVDRLVHEEAHLCTTNSVQTILERVDGTAANILLRQVVAMINPIKGLACIKVRS